MAVASGAALPWVMPSHSSERVASQANAPLAPVRAGAEIAAAAAATTTLSGTIVVGDEPVAGATKCLESRGIDVYPQPANTAEDLLAMVSRASRDYAVVVIHTGHRDGLDHPDWTLDGLNLTEQGCREYARKVAKLSGLPRGT